MMMCTQKNGGFTLVELMVSLVIALVVILAATQLYSSTRQTYRVQTMQNRLSEDGRFAISMLQRTIAQAGFKPTPATIWTATFPGATQRPISPTSATSMTLRFVPDGVNQIACNGSQAALGTAPEMIVSGANGKLLCDPAPAGGGDDVPWIESVGAGTELVDFLLEYGTDTAPTTAANFGCGPDVTPNVTKTGDCVADTYTLASAQAAPLQIVAVRACIVLRSDVADISINKAAAYKNCSNADIAGSQSDRKLYRTFRTTVLLRNR